MYPVSFLQLSFSILSLKTESEARPGIIETVIGRGGVFSEHQNAGTVLVLAIYKKNDKCREKVRIEEERRQIRGERHGGT